MFLKQNEENDFIILPKQGNIIKKLPPGIYDFNYSPGGFNSPPTTTLKESKINKDLKRLNHGIYKETGDFINDFLSSEMEEIYKNMNSYHKVGLLLYGRPGTGKTVYALQLGQQLVKEKQGIVLFVKNSYDPDDIVDVIDGIRIEDPNVPIMVILDEFEKLYKNAFESSQLLSFLDGANSRDKLIIIATANKISHLPDTLTQRPGRFERQIEFKIQDKQILTNIVEGFVPKEYHSKINISELVDTLSTDMTKKKGNKLGLNNKGAEATIDYIRLFVRDEIFVHKALETQQKQITANIETKEEVKVESS